MSGRKEGEDYQGEEVIAVELAVLGLVTGGALVMEMGKGLPHVSQGC